MDDSLLDKDDESGLNRIRTAESRQNGLELDRVHAVFDAAPTMLWITEPDGSCSFLSTSWYEFTGQNESNGLGSGWLDVVHLDDREALQHVFKGAYACRKSFSEDVRIRRNDGTYRWTINSGQPRFKGEDFQGFVGSMVDVHARKRAEESRRSNEERLRLALDSANLGSWRVDPATMEVSFDERYRNIFGIREDRVVYQDVIARIHPDDQDRVREAVARATSPDNPDSYSIEHRILNLDGSSRWIAASGRAIFQGRERELVSFEGTVSDITDRKIAEETQRRNAETFGALIERCPLGIYTVDADFRIAHVSEGAWSAFQNVQPVIGRDFAEVMRTIWPDEFAEVAIGIFRHTLETGESYESPGLIEKRRDIGQIESYEWQVTRVMLADGRYGVVCYYFDSTRLQETAQALRESEEKYRALSEVVPAIIWSCDAQGALLHLNQRWLDYTGQTEEEWVGVGWADALHPDDRDLTLAHWKECVQNAALYEGECRYRRQDGAYRWHYYRALPLRDENNGVVAWYGAGLDVHERKMTEMALVETRSRLESTLVAGEVGTWEFDVVNNVIRTDADRAEKLFGVSDAEAIGGKFADYLRPIHEDDRDRVTKAVEMAIAKGDRYEQEYRLVLPDGSIRWIVARGRVERDGDGKALRMPGVAVDITAQRRAEAELLSTRERWYLALEAAEFGTWTIDATSRRLESDKRFRRIISGRSAPIDYDQWFEFIHSEDRDRIYAAIEAAMNSSDPVPYGEEFRVVPTEGSVRWVSAVGKAKFENVAGGRRLVSLDGTVSDITERKRAEIERIRLASIVENSPDFIAIYDAEGDPLYLNRSGRKLVGLPLDFDVSTTQIRDFFVPDDRDLIDEMVLPELSKEGRWVEELSFRHWQTGEPIPVLFDLFRVDDPETGKPINFATIARDITERKSFELVLIDADRRKDEFLATLAHELRNPLGSIRTGLELIRLASDDKEMMVEVRDTMETQTKQLVRLVDDLMDVSRITSGRITLQTERVDLASIVRNAVDATRSIIESAQHELTVKLPSASILLRADAARLIQVISNLLTNAARYTPTGGNIALTVEQENQVAVIRVADSGIGIAKDMLERIFDMFTQVDQTHYYSQGGLGIGLTLVKRLTEMHGGSVEVFSDGKNKGSVFVVRIPAWAGAADEQQLFSSTSEESVPRKVLVVDDNQPAADMLSKVVSMLGHDVCTAYDGLEGVKVAQTFKPDIVLMDLGMPRLNGYDAARRIRLRTWGKDILLIALTGWGQKEDRERTKAAGFDHHLVKPAEPNALKAIFDAVGKEGITTE